MTKLAKYCAGLYCRLSAEDGVAGESGSIETQRTLLTQYCNEQGFSIHDVYCDDGWSGTSFDRPNFQRMIADIEAGLVNLVIVKDLSRFGREYAQMGLYIEHFL
jgi:DNA invertase Pin-like site-specific DNA recombinase